MQEGLASLGRYSSSSVFGLQKVSDTASWPCLLRLFGYKMSCLLCPLVHRVAFAVHASGAWFPLLAVSTVTILGLAVVVASYTWKRALL